MGLRRWVLLCYSFINVELWGEWDVEEPLGVLKHLEALLFCNTAYIEAVHPLVKYPKHVVVCVCSSTG